MKVRNKILAVVLAICFFSVLSLSLTFFGTERRLTNYAGEVNTLLIGSAAYSAEYALVSQAHDFLRTIAQEQADSFNRLLESLTFNILLMEGVMQDIFNNPHVFPYSRPIVEPSEIIPGNWATFYTLAAHIPMTDSIRRELDLLSNMNLLLPLLTNANPTILQIYVGMESGLFYNYTGIIFDDPTYDPRLRPWYIDALENPGEVIFTEVYEDAFGAGLVMTAAKTVFGADGELLGVVAFDIMLGHLIELISATLINDSDAVFILNSDGEYIIHSDMARYEFEAFQSSARSAPGLAGGYSRMKRGEEGIYEGEVDGERVFLTFSPIPFADWSVGFIMRENELLTPLYRLMLHAGNYIYEADARIADMSSDARFTLALITLLILFMVILLAVWLTKIVSEPIAYEKATLERLSRVRDEVFANISHETKTPLTAISANIQLAATLRKEKIKLNNKYVRLIDEALRQAQEDVLRVARINESARWLASLQDNREYMQALNMAEFLPRSAETYRSFIEKWDNTYVVNVDKNLPQVFANSDQIVQVIMNLLTNANNYTEKGLISLDAKYDGGFVKIVVRDTGAGITPELLPRIFERGVTGGGGVAGSDGLGLGLPISKDIIESHGGSISIESELGKGTAVTVLLPEHITEKEPDNA